MAPYPMTPTRSLSPTVSSTFTNIGDAFCNALILPWAVIDPVRSKVIMISMGVSPLTATAERGTENCDTPSALAKKKGSLSRVPLTWIASGEMSPGTKARAVASHLPGWMVIESAGTVTNAPTRLSWTNFCAAKIAAGTSVCLSRSCREAAKAPASTAV